MNGKAKVITTILRLDKPFKPPHIGDVTGLSPQLIRYHLLALMDANLIEKHNKVYFIKDKEALFDELSEVSEKMEVSKMRAAGIFKQTTVDNMNGLADTIICGKQLNLPMAAEAKTALLKTIDDSTLELKRLRRYVVSSQRTNDSARRKLRKVKLAEIYILWTEWLRYTPTLTEAEWVAEAGEILDDED